MYGQRLLAGLSSNWAGQSLRALFIVTLSGSEGSEVLSAPTILVPEDFRFFAFGSECQFAIVIVDAVVVGIVLGEILPLPPSAAQIENGVDYLTQVQFRRASGTFPSWVKPGPDDFPLLVGHIAGVSFLSVQQWQSPVLAVGVGSALPHTTRQEFSNRLLARGGFQTRPLPFPVDKGLPRPFSLPGMELILPSIKNAHA